MPVYCAHCDRIFLKSDSITDDMVHIHKYRNQTGVRAMSLYCFRRIIPMDSFVMCYFCSVLLVDER